ncbi:hypothetical protein ACQUFE_18380, partial [Enterococcus casseliflavus]|uniref:hypothetical protein n=1 Tax=Enterococcus casseliflavus TaxID=37734 RepID=UPI003D0BE885
VYAGTESVSGDGSRASEKRVSNSVAIGIRGVNIACAFLCKASMSHQGFGVLNQEIEIQLWLAQVSLNGYTLFENLL